MKVFISWSGNRSKAVAEVLRDWIRCVLQATRPWISAKDIDRGALWFNEISEQLRDTSVAIICLTHENKDRPWILFEAGAVMKGLSASRICTFLIDLQIADIDEPLYHFNHTLPTKQGVWSLIDTLNKALGPSGLDERILPQVFELYWPQLEQKVTAAINDNPPSVPPKVREQSDILLEILSTTRQLSGRISKLERKDDGVQYFDGAGEVILADREGHGDIVFVGTDVPQSVKDLIVQSGIKISGVTPFEDSNATVVNVSGHNLKVKLKHLSRFLPVGTTAMAY